MPRRPLPVRRAPVVRAALLLVAVGCTAGTRPSPTPAGFETILQGLAIRGVTVEETIGGDPGCDVPELRDNALKAGIRYEGVRYDIHLFAFRNARAFDAAAASFDQCHAAHRDQVPGVDVPRVDVPPYRAFGGGWGPALQAVVRDALSDAASGRR